MFPHVRRCVLSVCVVFSAAILPAQQLSGTASVMHAANTDPNRIGSGDSDSQSPRVETYSSSAEESLRASSFGTPPFAAGASMTGAAAGNGGTTHGAAPAIHTAPFSALAVGVRVGLLGIGFEAATPLSEHLNLRAGANFFSYNDTFTTNGIVYSGNLHLRSADATLDWYPWAKGFRVSGGALLYNGNNITGNANVPGGNTFSLNDVEYLSSTADPVTGNASLKFNEAAPKLTVGWGNHIPRSGRHFSFPMEIGFAYIGDPKLVLNLEGTACDPQGLICEDVATNEEIQSNLKAQQEKYQKDADPARFYPIISAGFAFSF